MGEDEYDPPIILGRPFLNTIKIRMRRRRRNRNQRRKIIKDGWVDYEGEVVRSEDIQLEHNCLEGTVAPSQEKKIVIHEVEAPPEPPTTLSSESQDD